MRKAAAGCLITMTLNSYELRSIRGYSSDWGQFPYVPSVNKFGRNSDIDTATDPEDAWSGGGVWAAPTAARIHQIASTDAADTLLGTGVRTLRLWGLKTWSAKESTEDISMNGISNVPTQNAYVIIHRMRWLTVGSGGTNAGVITATADTDSTVTAHVPVGKGQTQMAVYGFPSVQNLYVTQYYASFNLGVGGSGAVDIDLMFNPAPDQFISSFLSKQPRGLSAAGTSSFNHPYNPYMMLEGPGILKVTVDLVTANNADVTAGFDAYLLDNQ